ncbi:hypothetical protein OSB04_019769 [Centaurea solstitialis]|uniref:Uncharacterized protein n=1 Tax=Centaurea solstitialis TaxID=347529 RepID=A0AA38T2F5_9ASTR|nr:hypothetical protein OSB04_019769 [Centaurea solstitialis]
MQFGEYGDQSFDLFSKCMNLKDLTLDRFTIWNFEFFALHNFLILQLQILTPSIPMVFNVLSKEGMNSLEKVNLCLPRPFCEKDRYAPGLLDLFHKLRSAKFLIFDTRIIEDRIRLAGELPKCQFHHGLYFHKEEEDMTMTRKYGEDIATHPRMDSQLGPDTMGGKKKGSTDKPYALAASANEGATTLQSWQQEQRAAREQALKAEMNANMAMAKSLTVVMVMGKTLTKGTYRLPNSYLLAASKQAKVDHT